MRALRCTPDLAPQRQPPGMPPLRQSAARAAHVSGLPCGCPAGRGEGTQQLEEALARRFDDVPILRFDRDRTSRTGVMDEQLEQVRAGGPCLLVGTQMLAKGHHFPEVTLVVIVNIDQALYSADFRALERMGQMIQQVAGRAGRMEKPGTVILQTLHPDHAALELLLRQGYEAYARWLLAGAAGGGSAAGRVPGPAPGRSPRPVSGGTFPGRCGRNFSAGRDTGLRPDAGIMERVGGRSRMYLVVQGPAAPLCIARLTSGCRFCASCLRPEKFAGRLILTRRIYR